METENVETIRRPGGVAATAAIAMMGSLFTLLVAAGFAFVPIPQPSDTPSVRGFALGMAACLTAFGVFGIWTSIALYRMRPWSRISILLFAAFMLVTSALSIAFIALVPVPVPPGRDADTMRGMLPFMIGVYSVPLLLAVWWLIEFNRPVTKAAFAAMGPLEPAARPFAISVLAVLFMSGALSGFVPALMGLPLFVAGVVVEGWAARLAYTIFGAINFWIGWGLWKLEERARKGAIAYVLITGVHGLLIYSVPSMRAKIVSMQKDIPIGGEQLIPQDIPEIWLFSAGASVLFVAVVTWFLVKKKPAFGPYRPGNSEVGHLE